MLYVYSRRETGQGYAVNEDELMDALQRNLTSFGDPAYALWTMLRDGLRRRDGASLPGIQDLMDRARRAKHACLERYGQLLQNLQSEERTLEQPLATGSYALPYEEALRLLQEAERLERLEAQFRHALGSHSLDGIDAQLLEQSLGEDTARSLETIRSITRILEEAGYICRTREDYRLTPRGMRVIGQKALRHVFSRLKKDRAGGHELYTKGLGGDTMDETRRFQFGDPLQLNLERTIMNALHREPQAPPIRLTTEDFEIFETERSAQSATVLMLDLSRSMPARGHFRAAKQVAIALDGLIRSQYPKDQLHIVGFSSYAREMTSEDLFYVDWDSFGPYTNMQHGFALARKLLARERQANRQIIMITDGEPTAHVDEGELCFQYPPSPRTVQLTLREVRECTRDGITINTFMLERSASLKAFVSAVAHINRGRVFFTSGERLGQYLIVDYITSKKQTVR